MRILQKVVFFVGLLIVVAGTPGFLRGYIPPAYPVGLVLLVVGAVWWLGRSITWTSAVGRSGKWLLYKVVHGLALTRISPNALTFIGLCINVVAGILFGYAHAENQPRMFLYAGLVIIGAGIFDMVDGRVARATNQVTQFGGFFDSIIDRYSDVVLFFGLLVYYARANRFFYVVLTAFVMTSSVMVSYARARAESLIPSCKVGFMERPERIVLVIIGALFNRMGPVLWVIAVLSTITVVHRVSYTYQQLRVIEPPPTPVPPDPLKFEEMVG